VKTGSDLTLGGEVKEDFSVLFLSPGGKIYDDCKVGGQQRGYSFDMEDRWIREARSKVHFKMQRMDWMSDGS